MKNLKTSVNWTIGVMVLVAVALLQGQWVSRQADARWRAELIEKGYAEYHRKTGEWFLLSHEQVIANSNPSLFGGVELPGDSLAGGGEGGAR